MDILRKNNGFFPTFFNEFDNAFLNKTSASNISDIAVNIKDRKEDFLVELAIPGIKKEQLSIDLIGNKLTIKGEKKIQKEMQEENYTRKEFSFGTFERSFTLPKEVDVNKIDAVYTDGILKVSIPKPEDKKNELKKIEIKAA